MRRSLSRGFTLIELVIVVAVIAVLAAVAYGIERAATRNASMGGAVYDLASTFQGLRPAAMSAGVDHLLVVVDSPSDASDCGVLSYTRCLRWFILKNPAAAWVLDSFDPSNPGVNAEFVSSDTFPTGVHLSPTVPASTDIPAPFTGTLTAADPQLTTTCAGLTCFALRFTADGNVRSEFRSGVAPVTKAGYLFAIGNNLASQTNAAGRRAVLIGFPVGLVKIFSF